LPVLFTRLSCAGKGMDNSKSDLTNGKVIKGIVILGVITSTYSLVVPLVLFPKGNRVNAH